MQYEVVRRMYIDRGFSAEDIDVILEACRQTLLRPSNETGLLWNVSQRQVFVIKPF